jgi:hypothetical protein
MLYAAAQRRNRALQTGIHWSMMALVRSIALAPTARNGGFYVRVEFAGIG